MIDVQDVENELNLLDREVKAKTFQRLCEISWRNSFALSISIYLQEFSQAEKSWWTAGDKRGSEFW